MDEHPLAPYIKAFLIAIDVRLINILGAGFLKCVTPIATMKTVAGILQSKTDVRGARWSPSEDVQRFEEM